jgi:hypothetical protein
LIEEATDAFAEKLNSVSGLDAVASASLQMEIERRLEERRNLVSSK